MFKCIEDENSVVIEEYFEELNQNDFTHIKNLLNIAMREENYLSRLKFNRISQVDYDCFTIFQNIYEAEKFIKLFKIKFKRFIDRNYSNTKIDELIIALKHSELYSDQELWTILDHIEAMCEFDKHIFPDYEDDDFIYEEDVSTLNASIYPYQLFL